MRIVVRRSGDDTARLVIAPAIDGSRRGYGAGGPGITHADLLETHARQDCRGSPAIGRCTIAQLAPGVVTPAIGIARMGDAACGGSSRGDILEAEGARDGRWSHSAGGSTELAPGVVTPAIGRSRRIKSANMEVPCGELAETDSGGTGHLNGCGLSSDRVRNDAGPAPAIGFAFPGRAAANAASNGNLGQLKSCLVAGIIVPVLILCDAVVLCGARITGVISISAIPREVSTAA